MIQKGTHIMFESEFAKTEYIANDNTVFHVWKKEAHFDDYKQPVTALLEMLREHIKALLPLYSLSNKCVYTTAGLSSY